MTAYWLARAKINDHDEYMKYTTRVPGILEKSTAKSLPAAAIAKRSRAGIISNASSSLSLSQ